MGRDRSLNDSGGFSDHGHGAPQTTACQPDAAGHTDLWTVARHLAAAGRRDLALACGARLIPDVRRGKDEPPFTGAPLPDDTTVDAYRRAATAAPLAGVRARYHDLLWLHTRDHEHARSAVDAYLQAWREPVDFAVTRADGLIRAYEIARRLQDSGLTATTRAAVIAAAEQTLDETDDPAPGVALPLIESLLAEPPTGDEVDRLTTRADEAYGADPRLFASIQAVRAQRLRRQPALQRELWREAVSRYAQAARAETGLLRLAHLQSAVELAEEHGLSDAAGALRAEIRAIPRDELELQTTSAHVDIPTEDLDRHLQRIVGDDDIVQEMLRLAHAAPTFDTDADRAAAREHLAQAPLLSLFPSMSIGPEGNVVGVARSPEEHAHAALWQHRALRLSVAGVFAVLTLQRIVERYGPLAQSGPGLAGGFLDPVVQAAGVRAMSLYEAGDYDAAGHLLVPRIERAIRRLAGSAGIPVDSSGGVLGLGAVLEDLRGVLDERVRLYLVALLTEPAALNVRNRVSHGLVDEVDQPTAALLIQALWVLRLLHRGRGAGEGGGRGGDPPCRQARAGPAGRGNDCPADTATLDAPRIAATTLRGAARTPAGAPDTCRSPGHSPARHATVAVQPPLARVGEVSPGISCRTTGPGARAILEPGRARPPGDARAPHTASRSFPPGPTDFSNGSCGRSYRAFVSEAPAVDPYWFLGRDFWLL